MAHVVEEDFLMGRHEYTWHCFKAPAHINTVWQSMDSQSRLCVLFFLLWRRCLSLLFEVFSPEEPLQKSVDYFGWLSKIFLEMHRMKSLGVSAVTDSFKVSMVLH